MWVSLWQLKVKIVHVDLETMSIFYLRSQHVNVFNQTSVFIVYNKASKSYNRISFEMEPKFTLT